MNRITQKKGDIAVTQSIATFTRLGYDVSLPITESAPYDIIVDVDGDLKKVQCKYSSKRGVDLRCVHTNSNGYVVKRPDKNSYDWLYLLNCNGEYLTKRFVDQGYFTPPENDKITMEGPALARQADLKSVAGNTVGGSTPSPSA